MVCQLCSLPPGQAATVIGLTSVGGIRRRLIDIGIITGARIECVQKSPLGDPAAYLIRGAVIALRNEDSMCVLVRWLDSPGGTQKGGIDGL